MDWKKMAPWNWFREEHAREAAAPVPVRGSAHSDPLSEIRSAMDRVFDEHFRSLGRLDAFGPAGVGGAGGTWLRPRVDITETRKAYKVCVELPGVEVDDVSIQSEDGTLVIRAEKRREVEDDEEGYHWIERSYGAVQRVLSLPDDADAEAIEAKFKNGVLKLKIPKQAARTSGGRSIAIEAG